MAFFDFLDQGIGGTQQAAGPNQNGTAGVMQPIGPTWGDTIAAANAMSSRQPPAQMTLPANNSVIQPLQPAPLIKPEAQKNVENQDDSMGSIVSMLLKLFGL